MSCHLNNMILDWREHGHCILLVHNLCMKWASSLRLVWYALLIYHFWRLKETKKKVLPLREEIWFISMNKRYKEHNVYLCCNYICWKQFLINSIFAAITIMGQKESFVSRDSISSEPKSDANNTNNISRELYDRWLLRRCEQIDFDVEAWYPILQCQTFYNEFILIPPLIAQAFVNYYQIRYN